MIKTTPTAQDYQDAERSLDGLVKNLTNGAAGAIGLRRVDDFIQSLPTIRHAIKTAAGCSSDQYSVYLKMANGHEDPWDKTVLRENAGRFKEMLAATSNDIDPAEEGVKS